jgi:hypothetical protein
VVDLRSDSTRQPEHLLLLYDSLGYSQHQWLYALSLHTACAGFCSRGFRILSQTTSGSITVANATSGMSRYRAVRSCVQSDLISIGPTSLETHAQVSILT